MHRTFKARTDGGQLIWYPNLKRKIGTYATELGLTPAELAAVESASDEIVDSILDDREKTAEAAMVRAIKRQKQREKGAMVAGIIARFKTSPGYTDAIGQDLDVVSSNVPLDPLTFRPLLRAKLVIGGVRLNWVRSDADAMKIYRRLKGQ